MLSKDDFDDLKSRAIDMISQLKTNKETWWKENKYVLGCWGEFLGLKVLGDVIGLFLETPPNIIIKCSSFVSIKQNNYV